jgi:hypothetical protein
VLVFAGVIISVFALSAWYVHVVASAKWTALRERVLKVYSDAKARERTRPVLRGEPLPGNAWDDYSVALPPADRDIYDLGRLDWKFEETITITRAEIILSKYQAALDHLRTGVRRTEGRFPYVWEEGDYRITPRDLGGLLALRILATTQARLLHAKGADRDAALLLLDLLQFNRDCVENGTDLSQEYISGWGELRDLLTSGKLLSQDAKEISRELEILEGAWPRHGDLLLNWNAWLSRKELDGETEPKLWRSRFGGPSVSIFSLWRYGFSQRIAVADAQGQIQEWFSKIAGLEDGSWSEEHDTAEKLRAEMDRARNPIVQRFRPEIYPTSSVWSWWRRSAMAKLRAFRIAAEYLGTGRILDLEDPFGGRMDCEVSGGMLRIAATAEVGKDVLIEVER